MTKLWIGVLTAAHCDEASIHWIQDAHHEGLQDIIESVTLHPNYQPHYVSEDFALVKLTEATDYARIQFFADLNAPTYVQDAPITIDGFGGYSNQPPARATYKMHYKVQNYPFKIEAMQTGLGYTTNGDSGAAWVNGNNELVAILTGANSTAVPEGDQTIGGRDLHYAADFILDTVNGWHYPTIATAKGRTTIEVQSLHRGRYRLHLGGCDDRGGRKFVFNRHHCPVRALHLRH